ncbi:hypothetical protein F5146DRAFT_1004994 [Armillaria mellea]|nr:hypothetical protein F5146DRAFT_1004994 [Armillaria mellea]
MAVTHLEAVPVLRIIINVMFNARIMAQSSHAYIYSLCTAQVPRERPGRINEVQRTSCFSSRKHNEARMSVYKLSGGCQFFSVPFINEYRLYQANTVINHPAFTMGPRKTLPRRREIPVPAASVISFLLTFITASTASTIHPSSALHSPSALFPLKPTLVSPGAPGHRHSAEALPECCCLDKKKRDGRVTCCEDGLGGGTGERKAAVAAAIGVLNWIAETKLGSLPVSFSKAAAKRIARTERALLTTTASVVYSQRHLMRLLWFPSSVNFDFTDSCILSKLAAEFLQSSFRSDYSAGTQGYTLYPCASSFMAG